MPLIPCYGDILEQEADVIVVPHVRDSAYTFPITAKIIEAADTVEMGSELSKIDGWGKSLPDDDFSGDPYDEDNNELFHLHPLIRVTDGCCLQHQRVCIHLTISGMYSNAAELYCCECMANCYRDTLSMALECDVKSIVFPLLESCILGLPEKEAWKYAKNAVNKWLEVKEKKLGAPVDMKIYIVSDAIESGEKFDAFKSSGCFLEYEKKLQEKLSKVSDKDKLKGQIVYDYFKRMGDTEISSIIGWNVGSINKLRNKQINLDKGEKRRGANIRHTIALAVVLKLNDYERFEFIRCLGHKYPTTEQDFQVEKILRSGVTEFREVNAMLHGLSPELALMPPDEVPEPEPKKQKKATKNKKNKELDK